MITFSHVLFTLILAVAFRLEASNAARVNVTLRMSLTHDVHPGCDETVYKVVVCAGEFTNECELLPPTTRFVQAACAAQGSPEPLTFSVNSVENPIELDVTVTRVGNGSPIRLRRTEFLLTEGGEVSVTSMDLTLIVRFQVDYFCLPNYFGKLCDKFCDTKAEEHICDEWGNPICRSGYFLDQKSGECRQDQCLSMANYCLNGGTCVNSPDLDGKPRCLCPSNFGGAQCEIEHISTAPTYSTSTAAPIYFHTNTTRTSEAQKQSTDSGNTKVRRTNDSGSRRIKTVHGASATNATVNKLESITRPKLNVPKQNTISKAEAEVYYRANSREQSRYREIMIPIIVVTLVLALLTVCVGFIAWVWSRKDKKRKRVTKLPWDGSCTNALKSQPNRWASVDQSPSRLYTLEDQKISSPGCLPSLNEASFPTYTDSADPDPNYNGSMHTTFIPSRYSAMDAFPTRVDNMWSDEANRFATMPRHYNLRRVTSELGHKDSLPSVYTRYTNLPRLTTSSFGPPVTEAFMDHYVHPVNLFGSGLTEPSIPSMISPMMSPRPGGGMSQIYPSICSREASINSTCYMNNFEPLTHSNIYGSVALPRDPLQPLVPPNELSNASVANNAAVGFSISTAPGNLVDVSQGGNFSTLPPPPPSEFADTVNKSEY